MAMDEKPLSETDTNDLGVNFEGSSKRGHMVEARSSALRAAFATDCDIQGKSFLSHCLRVLRDVESSDEHPILDDRAFMLSIVKDLAPRDAVERMLAVQMATTHVATIRSAEWLAKIGTLQQAQAHYTGYTKLARTFAAQVEALRKHRTGGEQKVTVQHVNVADGGQAIVGNVKTGGRCGNE